MLVTGEGKVIQSKVFYTLRQCLLCVCVWGVCTFEDAGGQSASNSPDVMENDRRGDSQTEFQLFHYHLKSTHRSEQASDIKHSQPVKVW